MFEHGHCQCGGGPLHDDAMDCFRRALRAGDRIDLAYDWFYERHSRPTSLLIAATHWIYDAFEGYKHDLADIVLAAPGSSEQVAQGPLSAARQLLLSIISLDSPTTLRTARALGPLEGQIVFYTLLSVCVRVKKGEMEIALTE